MIKTFVSNLLVFATLGLAATASHADTVNIKGADGLTLNANIELADGKTMADGLVLLTHGTLAHNKMEVIANLQKLLAERGVSSLAPNLSLGVDNRTGMYDCAVPSTHKHTDALDEIGLWLDYVKSQGATDVVLAGHSRGGNQTAWFVARENPKVVSKVVLLAPATRYADKEAKSFEQRHGKPLAASFQKAQALVDAGNGAQLMKGEGVLYCPGADVSAESFVSYYNNDMRQHTPNLVPMLGRPVLVIVGSEDKVVSGLIEEVKPLANGDDIQLLVLDGGDHFFLDFFVEDAADAIAKILE